MEREIIYIEIDEEITSVVEKIKNAKGNQVVLVFPKRANILQSIVSLKLLKRQAEKYKKEVIVVTLDRVGRHLASQVGFEVYQKISSDNKIIFPFKEDIRPQKEDIKSEFSLEEKPISKKEPIRKPKIFFPKPVFKERPIFSAAKEEKEKLKSEQTEEKNLKSEKISLSQPLKLVPQNKKILIAFLVLAFLFLFFVFYLILPQAKVLIFAKAKEVQKDLSLTVALNSEEIDYNKNLIPGKQLTAEEKVEGEFSSQGVKEINVKAEGILVVKNLSSSTDFEWTKGLETFVPESNPNLNFITPTPISKLKRGEVVEIKVIAEKAGEEYNLPAGTKFLAKALLKDPLQGIISISAKNGTAGGKKETVRIIAEQDINQAKNQIIAEKKEILLKKLLANQEPGYKIEEQAIVFDFSDFSTTPAVGEAGEKFKVQGTVKATVLAFKEDDFKKLILEKLKMESSLDEQILENEIEWQIKNIKNEEDKTILDLEVKGYFVPYYPLSEIQKKLTSLSKEKAESEILKLENVKRVEIRILPSFKRNLPSLPSNIKIEVKAEK